MGRYVVGVYLLDKSHTTHNPKEMYSYVRRKSFLLVHYSILVLISCILRRLCMCSIYVCIFIHFYFLRKAFARETRSFALQRFVESYNQHINSVLYKFIIQSQHYRNTIIVSHLRYNMLRHCDMILFSRNSLPNGS